MEAIRSNVLEGHPLRYLQQTNTCDSQESSFSARVDRHPSQERRYEVITKVKSYCATETDVRGGKKSWQKISVVSLERICKWEEEEGEVWREGGREAGSDGGTRAEAEERCIGEKESKKEGEGGGTFARPK